MRFLADKILVLFLCLLAGNAFSQVILQQPAPDSIRTGNYLTTDFDNTVNSAFLNSRFNYDLNEEKFLFTINNNYKSNVTKLQENFFRDQNDLKLVIDYKLFDNLYTGIGANISAIFDDKNVTLNQNANNFYFANFDYYPITDFYINSKLGYVADNQIGEKNTGIRGEINTEIGNFNVEDYITNSIVKLAYEDLTQKLNYNFQVGSEIFKSFSQFSTNTGRIGYYNRRNDFYLPASSDVQNEFGVQNNIESRLENFFLVQDEVNYLVDNNYLLTIGGEFSSRNVVKNLKYKSTITAVIFDNNYDSERQENRFRFSMDLGINFVNNITKIGIIHTERSENNQPINLEGLNPLTVRQLEQVEKEKNNNSSRTTLILDNTFRLSNTNSIKFSGSSSILRYDTDSDNNFDDRDELLLIGALSHIYNNLSSFQMETIFDVSSNKLSYIYKERSSNNNTNTIYRLTSNSTFLPVSNLTLKNSVQVLANYTVYEFEYLVSQVNSFSYRQLTVRDSIYYNFTDEFFLNVFTGLKYSEQGEFDNDEFAVRPLTYFEDVNFVSSLNYLFFNFIEFSAGYKFYQQKRFNYNEGVKELNSTIRNFGPLAGLKVYFKNKSYLYLNSGLDYFKYDDSSRNNSAASVVVRIIWNI